MIKNMNFDRVMRGLGEVAEIAEARAQPAMTHASARVDVKAAIPAGRRRP